MNILLVPENVKLLNLLWFCGKFSKAELNQPIISPTEMTLDKIKKKVRSIDYMQDIYINSNVFDLIENLPWSESYPAVVIGDYKLDRLESRTKSSKQIQTEIKRAIKKSSKVSIYIRHPESGCQFSFDLLFIKNTLIGVDQNKFGGLYLLQSSDCSKFDVLGFNKEVMMLNSASTNLDTDSCICDAITTGKDVVIRLEEGLGPCEANKQLNALFMDNIMQTIPIFKISVEEVEGA